MKKEASKATTRTKKVIPALAVAATLTACTPEPPKAEMADKSKIYIGDKWEHDNKLFNGNQYQTMQPTGDVVADFGAFTLGQGGGKSRNLTDSICWARDEKGNWLLDPFKNHIIDQSAFPNKPDIDGEKYHTVDDITWKLFCSPVLAAAVGYTPTPELFYEMPKQIRDGIVKWHFDKGAITSSAPVNAVLAYCVWGSGSYKWAVARFNQRYGDIETFIKLKGDYFVFYNLLICRQETMQERNRQSWPINGAGWSSGLAHFRRVFKVYCK